MADLRNFSIQDLIEELLNRATVSELSSLIINIDQSRRNSAYSTHPPRPDSRTSTLSFRSNSSLSDRYAPSSSSSIPPLRHSCDTTASLSSFSSSQLHKPYSPYSSPLSPDSTPFNLENKQGGHPICALAPGLPTSHTLNPIQPGHLDHAAITTQPKTAIQNPGRLLFCTFCAEQGIQKTVTFRRKSDWKDHETNFHETGYEWKCEVPQCSQLFDRLRDFLNHHKREHPLDPYSSDATVQLPRKVAFGCGFRGCKHVAYDWDERCNHVAKCTFFFAGADWDYSTKIRNLLRQNSIHTDWKAFLNLSKFCGLDRSRLQWTPTNSRVLRQKLECNDFGHLRDFFNIAIQLGQSPFPAPPTFVTPRAPISTEQETQNALEPSIQQVPTDQHAQNSFEQDLYPRRTGETVPHEDHELNLTFYLADEPFGDEGYTNPDLPHGSSQNRGSVMMLDPPSPNLWPTTDSTESIGNTIGPDSNDRIQEQPDWTPEFVNPGQSSNTIAEPYQHADSISHTRSSPGQRFRKSVRRVKSNLSSKKSQQFHQNTNCNHPELPSGIHSPNASSTGLRSTGGSRADPCNTIRYQP